MWYRSNFSKNLFGMMSSYLPVFSQYNLIPSVQFSVQFQTTDGTPEQFVL